MAWGQQSDLPDGKDTTSLGETSLLLDTTNSLLEDGGDLSGSWLGLSGVGSDLLGHSGQGAGSTGSDLQAEQPLGSATNNT